MKKPILVLLMALSILAAEEAEAQFELDKQVLEIANQVQDLLNRLNQYTALTNQFVNFDCASLGMALGAVATPEVGASVPCDTLNMVGSFRSAYQDILAAPEALLRTLAPVRNWRDVLAEADTVSDADLRALFPERPVAAEAAVAAYQERRALADRRVILTNAEADAARALTTTLQAARDAVDALEAKSAVTETGLAQTQLSAGLTRARVLVALSQLRAHQESEAAGVVYDAEVRRREFEALRLAERTARDARWAESLAGMAASRESRLHSLFGYDVGSFYSSGRND